MSPSQWAEAPDVAAELDREVAARGSQQIPATDLQPLATPTPATEEYRIGPSDELRVSVLGRAELSGTNTVGPDGAISLPLVGTLQLQGMTRNEAATAVSRALAQFFVEPPATSVEVTRYMNNRVFVLGRVETPGAVELRGSGTLLQVLSEVGGLPVREFRSFLSSCSIIRGRNQILEIDLVQLLQNGDLTLNVPLRNGDVVFVPDAEDAIVFVMGEVQKPGAVAMRTKLDVVQALAHVGGPTEHADLSCVWLVRRGPDGVERGPVRIDFQRLVEQADFRTNLQLKRGDVLYVARSGLGDMNYVLRQVQPAFTTLILGAALGQ